MACSWTRCLVAAWVSFDPEGPACAETCLSPFVKRLDRPEKYLYVFCLDAHAKNHDFLAVIDVDMDSPTYGKIIDQLDLGSSGNETHHFGFTDDRTHIWGCSLFSSRIFLIDVASNPAKPQLVKVLEDIPGKVGLTGPHSPYALPGRMLLSFLGGKDGGLPAGLAEFTNEGEFIRRLDLPADAPYMYDVAVKPDLNRMVTSSFTPLTNYKKPLAQMDLKNFGNKVLVWDFRERKVLTELTTGSGAAGVPLVAERRGQSRLHQLCPRRLDLDLGRKQERRLQRPQAVHDRQAAGRPAAVAG